MTGRILVGDWLVQFLPAHGTLQHEALEQAVRTQIEGVPTYVASAEHLVALALETGRAKHYTRIVQFLEEDAIDADKLNRLLTRSGLVSKWEKFRHRYLEEES